MRRFYSIALLFAVVLSGQSLIVPDQASGMPDELPAIVQQAGRNFINQAVNGAILFSSQNAVAAGSISIENQGARDTKIDIFKMHAEHNLGSIKDEFESYLIGNVGFFHQTDDVPPFAETAGEDDFSRLKALSITAGAGFHWRPIERLEISPSFSTVYSRLSNNYDYNNSFSQSIQPLVDRQIFNWDVDAWTYVPSIKAGYQYDWGNITLKASTQYFQLLNDSFNANSPLAKVHSSSGLLQSVASAKQPIGVCAFSAPLAARLFVSRSDIYGTARDGLPFTYFHEFGVDIIADLSELKSWITEFSLGGSYLVGRDIEGWRVGGGIKF